MAELPNTSASDGAAVPLRVAGTWSGQVEASLDSWTISDLRLHLSSLSGIPTDSINLISAGKVLKDSTPGTLREVGVSRNSKLLMTRVAAPQQTSQLLAEEERHARLSRIKIAADALVKRSSLSEISEDHVDIQMENQYGEKVIFNSENDKRALMLGLMLHAKGRDLILRESFNEAVEVLNMSEEALGLCDQKILENVDNVALLEIDIVWCYFVLKDIAKLADAGKRLLKARCILRRSHGPNLERLRVLQGGFCPELAVYVRLELLEGVVAFHSGRFEASQNSILSAQNKYNQLQVSDESLAFLTGMGFSVKESKRALRVSGQDVNRAIEFVMEERNKTLLRKQEDDRLKKQRRELKRYGLTISGRTVDLLKLEELVSMGYAKRLAAEALRQTENSLHNALDILSDPSKRSAIQTVMESKRKRQDKRSYTEEELLGLLAMGFERDQAIQALESSSNMDEAVSLILQGMVSSSQESASSSSASGNVSQELTSDGDQNAKQFDEPGSTDMEEQGKRDVEMEQDIATKLTGDPLEQYDVDLFREGEAICQYLEMLTAKTKS